MTTMALRRRALSFSSFISEERQINTHMDHIEDAVFLSGVVGARSAINYLQNLRNMLAGHAAAAVNVTVKFDGAPAIIAGTDPSDGKFFVAKKGIFNKNPKVYKTDADINADTSGDLATKLKTALKYFSKLDIENVVQGDLLFTADTVKRQTIDGEDYLTFQPNTIVYAVPVKSALGRKIAAAEIGVVWHTTYTGDSFDTMSASFGKSISDKLKQTSGVWHSDATFKDQSGLATMTQAETEHVTSILSSAGKLLKTIPAAVLNDIYNNEDLQIKIMTYNNTKVRAGERVLNPASHVTSLMHYIHDYYQKQVDQKKTEKGKSVQVDKRKAALKYFTDHSKADIVKVFELMNLFVDAKEIIIKKLNTVSALKTMLSTSNGFKVTTPEGYVAIDHLGKAVKLVDRLEFSRANFSADVKKGWQR